MLESIYRHKKVFITGHTGFKGSWLCQLLQELGAQIMGYALAPETNPNHYDLLNLDLYQVLEDIRNYEALSKAIHKFKPDIVFHLAAQPLVRKSYKQPIYTYQTNIIGTANLLEACRSVESIKAIVNVTTDKCYQNIEKDYAYQESDSLGGYDPYSSSKACSEIVTAAYRNSFYNLQDYGKKHQTLVATARSGNVIGGGDWSTDRLIPDLIRAAQSAKPAKIRYPKATRPWQHVLEPLTGYLLLSEKLLEGQKQFADAWNFGPQEGDVQDVISVIKISRKKWNKIRTKLILNIIFMNLLI